MQRSDRVALATGATSGIGIEIAGRLVADDLTVIVTGRSVQRAQVVAGRLGPKALFVPADLTAPHGPQALVTKTLELTGTSMSWSTTPRSTTPAPCSTHPPTKYAKPSKPTSSLPSPAFRRPAAPCEQGSGGVIVNITSQLASVGVPTMSIYSASKGGHPRSHQGRRRRTRPSQHPSQRRRAGHDPTPLYEEWIAAQDNREHTERCVAAAIPLGRIAVPSDVAAP